MSRNDDSSGDSPRYGAVEAVRSSAPSSGPWGGGASGEYSVPGSGEYKASLTRGLWSPESGVEAPASGPAGLGVSWLFLRGTCRVPTEVSLRAVLECLHLLERCHKGALGEVVAHGAVWDGNLMFRASGEVFLVEDPECQIPQPLQFVAPEVRTRGGSARRRTVAADVHAVGVMLLEVISDAAITAGEVSGSGEHGLDPLSEVARRAVSVEPERRWASAAEFSWALKRAGRGRIAPLEALVELIHLTLSYQADRATPLLGEALGLGREPNSASARLSVPRHTAASSLGASDDERTVQRSFDALELELLGIDEPTLYDPRHWPELGEALGAVEAASSKLGKQAAKDSGIAPRPGASIELLRDERAEAAPPPALELPGTERSDMVTLPAAVAPIVADPAKRQPRERGSGLSRSLVVAALAVALLGTYAVARWLGMPADGRGMQEWLLHLAWSRWY